MKKRMLAFGMACLMALTSMTVPAKAETTNPKSQIGPYYEVSQSDGTIKTQNGENVIITNPQVIKEDGNVKLDKTIAATDVENVFDVTLTVETKDKVEKQKVDAPAAVVLVVDVSTSMNESLDDGTERLLAAQQAAQEFINRFASTEAARKISIVAFCKDAAIRSDWKDASGLKTSDKTILCSEIENLRRLLGSGTNIEGGFLLANNLLQDNTTLSGIDSRHVILLSDGGANSCVVNDTEKTLYDVNYTGNDLKSYTTSEIKAADELTGFYGNANYHFHHNGAIEGASTFKGVAKLHTVYFGSASEVCTTHDKAANGLLIEEDCKYCEAARLAFHNRGEDVKVSEFLRDFADQFVEAHNTDALFSAFDSIYTNIEESIEAWKVIDPMGDNNTFVDFISSEVESSGEAIVSTDGTIKWDLYEADPEETAEGTHKYSLAYQVKLDTLAVDYAAGTYYPTNDPTKLTYYVTENGKSALHSAYFNIPSVKGFDADYTLTKVDESGSPLAGAVFEVTLWEKDPHMESHGDWSMTAVSDKDGKVTFEKIPSGHTFTIKEKTAPDGYKISDEAKEGFDIKISYGEIEGDNKSGTKEIVNTSKYTPAKAKIEGTKTLTGKDLAAGESFTFNLEAFNPAARELVLPKTTATVSGLEDGQARAFDFGEITFTKAGTYVFKVTEETGEVGGVIYDTHETMVTVNVTEGRDTLLATVEYDNGSGGSATKAVFHNDYQADPTTVTLTGTKVLNGLPLKADDFTFTIEAVTKDAPVPDLTEVKNAADGKVSFGAINYTAAGTYIYTIKEKSGSISGVSYDNGIVTATVTVTEDKVTGKLNASVSYSKAGGNGGEGFTFINNYTASPTDPINLNGTKNVTPAEGLQYGLDGGEFNFKITPSAENPEGDPITEQTVANDAAGNIPLIVNKTYSKPGTYKYTVNEVTSTLGGIVSDASVYEIVVTVTDPGTGKLQAQTSIKKGAEAAASVVFHNQYKATETTAIIQGTKTLSGKDLSDGEFTFVINAVTEGAPMPTAASVTNSVSGVFAFDEITYTQPGTYQYQVREANGGKAGYTYSTAVYTVTVKVTDKDANGQETGVLTASVSYGEGAMTFANAYSPAAASVVLGGKKQLNGATLGEKDFEFQLLNSDNEEVATAWNQADGTFAFDNLSFEKTGNYTYTIVEKVPETRPAGITYTTKTYTAVVQVTDEGHDGQLDASVTYYQEGNPVEAANVVFVNEYKVTPTTAVVSGQKLLTGRNMNEDEVFTFTLAPANDAAESMMPVEKTATVSGALNGIAKDFDFETLDFKAVGEYKFTITESGSENGITSDGNVTTVTITVTEKDAKLSAAVSYSNSAHSDVTDKAYFENTYTAQPVEVQVKATKVLEGRDLKDGEFRFVLEDKDGNKIYATNDEDGAIAFEKMKFEQAGKYIYRLYEEKGDDEDITYDKKVYRVTINVTDNGEGQLVTSSALEKPLVTFTNKVEDVEKDEKDETKDDKDSSKNDPTKDNSSKKNTSKKNSSSQNKDKTSTSRAVDSGDHNNLILNTFCVLASFGVLVGVVSKKRGKRN